MTLSGRELQALLGATLIHAHVPFADSAKPILSAEELRASETARATLLAAKRQLKPPAPRNPSTWQLMLNWRLAQARRMTPEVVTSACRQCRRGGLVVEGPRQEPEARR
jgi:hypothetical protein